MSPSHGPIHLPHFQGTVLSEKDNLLVVDQSSSFTDVITVVESRVSRALPFWFDVLCVVASRMSLSVVFTNFIWINANGYTNLRRRRRQNRLSELKCKELERRMSELRFRLTEGEKRQAEWKLKQELIGTLGEDILPTAVSEELLKIEQDRQTGLLRWITAMEERKNLSLEDKIASLENDQAEIEDRQRRLEACYQDI
ncbi:MAG: hypothetical protein Q9226_003453, partial [Calogaya cf. arnoldii]